MSESTWHVGQDIVLHDNIGRGRERRGKVTKIGRVYFEVDCGYRGKKYRIADGTQKTEYTPAHVYPVAQWEEMQATNDASRELVVLGIILERKAYHHATAILAAIRPILKPEPAGGMDALMIRAQFGVSP